MDYKEMTHEDMAKLIENKFPSATVWSEGGNELISRAAVKVNLPDYNCPCPHIHTIIYFPNKFGASIIRHDFSYGASDCLFELGVILFESKDKRDWELYFGTDITKDVLGYLNLDEVLETLTKIEKQKELFQNEL